MSADAPRFDLSTRRGQVFVTVHRAPDGMPPLDLCSVQADLDRWPVATRDTRALVGAVRGSEGVPVLCGTLQPAGGAAEDAPLAVVVSPPDGRPFLVPWALAEAPAPTAEALQALLLAAGFPSTLADEVELPDTPVTAPLPLAPAPPPRGVPGRFDIAWREGEAFLWVTDAARGGVAVRRDDVARVIEEVPGVVIDEEALGRALAGGDAEAVVIARLEPTARPDDGAVAVCVAGDGLAAYLVPWTHDPAQPLAPDAAEAVLAAAGIAHGVDPDALAALAQAPFDGPRLVARGTPAEHGHDAVIQWLDPGHASSAERHVPQVLDDGRVDYHDLGEEATVSKDVLLAVKTAAVPAGRPGRSVRGRDLPPRPGRDVPLARHAGPGTRVSEDGSTLVSTVGGLVVWSGNKLGVMTVRNILGDVDFKTGNVVFDGSVVVRGNVKGGFRVAATGSIQVNGEVADAVLEAGGDVRVNGGIVGGQGVVHAGGALQAGYLHSVDVEVAGPITVKSEVWQSRVISGDIVRVNGRIVGGEVVARQAVVAQTFGAAVGTPTTIGVGGDAPPTEEVRSQPGFRPAMAVAAKTAFPGVTVTIDGFRRDVEKKLPAVTFRQERGEVQGVAGARML